MKAYNGFQPDQRYRANRWLNKLYAAGTLARAQSCDACGQTRGPLDHHAEDYSEPFGPWCHAYDLCFWCHMMLHCRFNNAERWAEYRHLIREGHRFVPVGRKFPDVQAYLGGFPFPMELPLGVAARERTCLDDIHERVNLRDVAWFTTGPGAVPVQQDEPPPPPSQLSLF